MVRNRTTWERIRTSEERVCIFAGQFLFIVSDPLVGFGRIWCQAKFLLKRWLSKNISHAICHHSDTEVPIRELLTGYEPPEPVKDRLNMLITAAHHLQDTAATIKPDEDSRTGFIAKMLTANGIFVKDQTRAGVSASGKSPGRLDIKIDSPGKGALAIIEAFKLDEFNRTVIDSHIKKIFGYDASGLEDNFIMVYSEVNDFMGLWKKYLNHLAEIDYPFKLTGRPLEQETCFTDIKAAKARHLRQGKETCLYHLFVNMNPRGDIGKISHRGHRGHRG